MSFLSTGRRGRTALPAILAAVVLLTAACGAPASQGGYPTRNVQLIVPYPAGSAIDATSRALVEIDPDGYAYKLEHDGAGGTKEFRIEPRLLAS